MRRTGDVPGGSDAYARALAELGRELAGPDGLNAAIARLYEQFDHYSWIGFYRVEGGELVLGPWRGPQATEHVRIPVGKGICGAAAASGATEVVEDVAADPRYLSCFVSTRSEIVVPVSRGGRVVGEIDIDSDRPGAFDDHDRAFLDDARRDPLSICKQDRVYTPHRLTPVRSSGRSDRVKRDV